jgi:ADP-ribose pyrophosphatase YjhB (NUDIX family)
MVFVKDELTRIISEQLHTMNLHETCHTTNAVLEKLLEVYWFFLDYLFKPFKKTFSFKDFLYKASYWTKWNKSTTENNLRMFWKYLSNSARCGGILLNHEKTHVLLVRNINCPYYNFPQGKITINETYKQASVREVFEETGYLGRPSDCFVHNRSKKQYLFVYFNVPMYYNFEPQTRYEIDNIKWVKIKDMVLYFKHLPTVVENKLCYLQGKYVQKSLLGDFVNYIWL